MALPETTKLLVKFEKWDYPETATIQQIYRNFVIKLINLTTFILVNYGGVLKLQIVEYSDDEVETL